MDTVGCNCQYFGFSFGLLSGARVRRNSLPMIVRSYVWRCSRTISSMERIKVASYFERFSNFVLFFFFLRGERWIEIYHIGSIVVNRIIVNYRKTERERERDYSTIRTRIFFILVPVSLVDEQLLRFICRLPLRSREEMLNQSIEDWVSLGDMAANEKRYKKIEMKEIVGARKHKR